MFGETNIKTCIHEDGDDLIFMAMHSLRMPKNDIVGFRSNILEDIAWKLADMGQTDLQAQFGKDLIDNLLKPPTREQRIIQAAAKLIKVMQEQRDEFVLDHHPLIKPYKHIVDEARAEYAAAKEL